MRKKITSVGLLVLVASLTLSGIPNFIFADSQSDSLIRIATQARDQLSIQLSKVDVSQEIKEKFDLGSAELEKLIEAANKEDVPAARQHFLSTMKIFNEIIQQISETTLTSEAAVSAAQPNAASSILHELDRLDKYIDRLKEISVKHGYEIDFTHVDELIEKARNEIREGGSEAANSAIEEIKQSIIELNQMLKEKTRQYTTERAKSFAEKHLKDLDRLIAQAQDIGVSQDTIDRLIEAKKNLNSASDASNVKQIIDEVKHIISVKQHYEDTKIKRLNARINQLESNLERLSNYADEIPELDKAKDMLSELMDLVYGGNLNEAIRVMHSLNNLIIEFESSISHEEIEVATSTDQKTSSIADSKTERIKIKIERLETKLNQLAEEVEENAAAKRWLNNAFSLLQETRNYVEVSPDDAMKTIMKIQQIIERIQKITQ